MAMTNHRILIGSVLKPTNDARMYEKIGKSLSLLVNTEIHIAGFKSNQPNQSNLHFYPIFSGTRISLSRCITPWKFFLLALKVKPDTIIVSTHELLLVTYLYKILFGGTFIYDVQENYFHNILYTDAFPSLIKSIIARWVRFKERVCKKHIDGYLLAEKIYKKELQDRLKEPVLVLENKYVGTAPDTKKIVKIKDESKVRLLYSGTIATSYGVFEAIDLVIRLYLKDSRFELTIIGFAPSCRELTKVKNRIAPFPFIKLIGGEKPVDHTEILSAIQSHNIGLLPYRFNESTHLRVPTKLFEYFLNHLPVICSYNPTWKEYIETYQAGIIIPFNNLPPANEILRQISHAEFYTQGDQQLLIWEESKLQDWYKEHFLNTSFKVPVSSY
jgi:glycosyltransferase involved in cell wall biosynthesis